MKGTIYLMSNSVDEMVYIGSTSQTLSDRMKGHRHCAKSGSTSNVHTYMRKIGLHKWTLDAIKTQEVEDRQELEKLEFRCMDFFHRSLLLNTDTEYKKKSAIAQRGDKTGRFKRGSITRENRDGRDFIKFTWFTWNDDKRTRRRKQFSINRLGEHTARKLAEAFRDTIYPITE